MSKKTINGVVVELNSVALAELLRGPSGPVYRKLVVDAEDVRQEAKRLVGVSDGVGRSLGPSRDASGKFLKGGRKPGTLRDSIVKRRVLIDGDIGFIVGSDDPVAFFHHEGTSPHEIRPVQKKVLAFYSRKAGMQVFATRVRHPGTKANPFLVNALRILRGR